MINKIEMYNATTTLNQRKFMMLNLVLTYIFVFTIHLIKENIALQITVVKKKIDYCSIVCQKLLFVIT